MGIALPKGTDSDLASWAIPSILGFLAGELGERGLPRLNSLARKHGFVPTMSLGFGSNVGVGLGVELEKRDRPLPRVPINTYLPFNLDSSLAVGEEAGETSTLLAKVGVRIDPGKQGGFSPWARSGPGWRRQAMSRARYRRSWARVSARRISSTCKWCARRSAAKPAATLTG